MTRNISTILCTLSQSDGSIQTAKMRKKPANHSHWDIGRVLVESKYKYYLRIPLLVDLYSNARSRMKI